MIVTNKLGKVSVTPRGEYDERQTYNYLDIVTCNGSSYLVLQQITGSAPPNSNFYQLLSLSGDAATVAEEFDSTATYSKGDYCLYDGELYRFISDKSAGGWNSSVAEQVVVCDELNNRIEKESFFDAGIVGESYTTILDTTTVTTTQHAEQTKPWALLSSTEDMLKFTRLYNCRVTFDGVEYIVKGQDWFSESGNTNSKKCAPTLGNISLVNDSAGFCGIRYDVPFLITDLMDISGSTVEGLYMYSKTAGSHTVKIERITYSYEAIPQTLIYGTEQAPIYVDVSSQTYNGYSIGSNRLIKSRQVVAIGYGNLMQKETTFALGNANVLNGGSAVAIGVGHTCSGISASVLGGQQGVASANFAVSIGSYNTASGQAAVAMGNITTASGAVATATGSQTVASGSASATFGIQTKANHRAQFVFGAFNEEDASSAESYSRGNYVEVVGNGTADDARSNARTLDWDGNESLAGGLTLGKGTANEVSITAQQLQRLLALLN